MIEIKYFDEDIIRYYFTDGEKHFYFFKQGTSSLRNMLIALNVPELTAFETYTSLVDYLKNNKFIVQEKDLRVTNKKYVSVDIIKATHGIE